MATLDETFVIENDHLVRAVVPKRGRPYEQTCTTQVYDDVAYAIEQMGACAFTGEEIRGRLDAPSTQVFVALAFLKERSCIVPVRGRRHQAAANYLYEDALIEWHALREKPEPSTET